MALGAAAVVVGAGAIALARGGDEDGSNAVPIDERAGSYRGVRFGASEAEVVRVFGEPDRSAGVAPKGSTPAEVGVPQSLPGPAQLLRYENVVFLLEPASGVYAFLVTEPRAKTTRGVSIGDGMDAAQERYRLECIEVAGGESLLGKQEFYPSCRARLGDSVRVWFGRDPIRSITVLSTRHVQQ